MEHKDLYGEMITRADQNVVYSISIFQIICIFNSNIIV